LTGHVFLIKSNIETSQRQTVKSRQWWFTHWQEHQAFL